MSTTIGNTTTTTPLHPDVAFWPVQNFDPDTGELCSALGVRINRFAPATQPWIELLALEAMPDCEPLTEAHVLIGLEARALARALNDAADQLERITSAEGR